jgi:4-hydroxybenzoate polyprenyltransferase
VTALVISTLRPYVAIARPDHWVKNAFALPGVVAAAVLTGADIKVFLGALIMGMISLSMAASANYVINEWLDAEFDKHHPEKSLRVCVNGLATARGVCITYAFLAITSLALGSLISPWFMAFIGLLLGQGIIYNVRPFRLKDVPYMDVLSESVNNPIRLYLGWFMVTDQFLPPSSLVAGYWAAGAFLMSVKRYAELRSLGDLPRAWLYRASFRHYTPDRLLISSFFYGLSAAFFLGVFLVKNRIELLLSLPFLAFLFSWYLLLGMQPNSSAQHPERLHKERWFMLYVLLVVLLMCLLMLVDLPWLHLLLNNQFIH